MSELQADYYGCPITERKIQLTRAGDGLSEGLDLDGVVIEPGEEGIVVLRVVHAGHKTKPVKADDPGGDYAETLTYQAVSAKVYATAEAAALDADLKEHEAKVAEARELAKEAKEGVKRLPYEDDAEAAAEDGVQPADVAETIAGIGDEGDDDVVDPTANYSVEKDTAGDGAYAVVQGGLTLAEAEDLRAEDGGIVTHPDQAAGADPVVDETGTYDVAADPYPPEGNDRQPAEV
jgi:hypothetical protein